MARVQPFLPQLASPSVQTPFEVDRSGTAYNESYRGHYMETRPRNHSLEHHQKYRKEFALKHVDDPADHYCTTTMSITSPTRREDLRQTERPAPFPLEAKKAIRTSAFAFQTTNDELLGRAIKKRQEMAISAEAATAEREVAKLRKSRAKGSTLAFHYTEDEGEDLKVAQGLATSSKTRGQRHYTSTKQLFDEASDTVSRNEVDAGRQAPYSYQDEIQVDRSYRGLPNAITSYRSNVAPIADYWQQPSATREALSPPRSLNCILPSLSLAHRSKSNTPAIVETPVGKSASQQRRQNYMQTTYQLSMSNPRAHSSLY